MTPPTADDLGTYDVVYIRFVLTHLPDRAVGNPFREEFRGLA